MSVRLEIKEKEKNVSLYAKLSFFLEATKVYRNSYIYIYIMCAFVCRNRCEISRRIISYMLSRTSIRYEWKPPCNCVRAKRYVYIFRPRNSEVDKLVYVAHAPPPHAPTFSRNRSCPLFDRETRY